MHEALARVSTFVDRAVYQGRLYMVARYPGAARSDEPCDRVIGEAYRLHDPDALLKRLDRYEGCNPVDPLAPYVRRLETVTLASGDRVAAWVYLYNRRTQTLPQIRSGDFLRKL